MVDPSKSKSDKMRPAIFLQFGEKPSLKTPHRSGIIFKKISSSNTNKNKVKPNIEFRSESGSKIDFKDPEHDNQDHLIGLEKVNDLATLDNPSVSVDKESILHKILLESLDHVTGLKKDGEELIFKMDPKYNPPKKLSHNKSNIQDLSFTKINLIGDGFTVPHNTNKVKKLTFVKTIPVSNGNISNVVGNNTPNYEKTIFNNSKFVKQSSKYVFENENLIIHKSLNKSSIGVKHTGENVFMKHGDAMDGIILSGQTVCSQNNDYNDNNNTSEHKFQMYQMDNHTNQARIKDKQSGKQIIEPKAKLNKTPINPPILEGYSTYTFKVNLKDK